MSTTTKVLPAATAAPAPSPIRIATGTTNGTAEAAAHPTDSGGCAHLSEALAKDDGSEDGIRGRVRLAVRWGLRLKEDGERPRKKRKLPTPTCASCSSPTSRPFLCVSCGNAYTQPHLLPHLRSFSHPFGIDCASGHVFCGQCDDFVYDPSLERIGRLERLRSEERQTKCQTSGRERAKYVPWKPNASEEALLAQATPLRPPPPRGLRNLGKTCFLNVVLQCLLANPLLRSYFLSDKHNSKLCVKSKDGCMCCELDKLFVEIHQPDYTPLGPTALLHMLWTSPAASDLAGYAQHDAHEAFISLLNLLHSSSRGSTAVSCMCVVHSTFAGQLQSEVRCTRCAQPSVAVDPILDVSLDVGARRGKAAKGKKVGPVLEEAAKTLEECLSRYTAPEQLEVTCSQCASLQTASKTLSFRRLPPVLTFQLKRYEHLSSAQKIDTSIRFPATLSMRPYATRPGAPEPEGLYEYELFAVVNHQGEMETGHYTCFVKTDEQWYRCEDADVRPATEAEVLASQGYMLLYSKKTLVYFPYAKTQLSAAQREELLKKEGKA